MNFPCEKVRSVAKLLVQTHLGSTLFKSTFFRLLFLALSLHYKWEYNIAMTLAKEKKTAGNHQIWANLCVLNKISQEKGACN